jgi:predicted MFS family arabinose efflux permease
MILACIPTALLWAGAGGLLSRLVEDPRLHRAIALAMAALLVATVATVWL